jgi:hypothetical protein
MRQRAHCRHADEDLDRGGGEAGGWISHEPTLLARGWSSGTRNPRKRLSPVEARDVVEVHAHRGAVLCEPVLRSTQLHAQPLIKCRLSRFAKRRFNLMINSDGAFDPMNGVIDPTGLE